MPDDGVVVPRAALERARAKTKHRKDQLRVNPFELNSSIWPPGVEPKEPELKLAQDDTQLSDVALWAASSSFLSAYKEGLAFMGYPYLAALAQRAEYRLLVGVLAEEMTREFIELSSTGEDDKADKIKVINDELQRLRVRHVCKEVVEGDGFFGRGHFYLDTGATEQRDELKTPLGDSRSKLSQRKVNQRNPLLAVRAVEAYWCYPTQYESTRPLRADWYRPQRWLVMGDEVHCTRLLTIVSRPLPDILKPAYAFGGLALTQMMKPYVDNWLRTRQSVADLLHSFTVWVLKAKLGSTLSVNGQALQDRVDFFNLTRDNSGVMVVDKETEDWANVSAPLGGLDALQASTLEHIAAIGQVPLVKFLGIQPAGLNASSEGEIRVFYDRIKAMQEAVLREPLTAIIGFIQLSKFGEVDPEITFNFKDLWQLDEAGQIGVEKTKTDIDDANVAMGAISPEEVRKRLEGDKKSIYTGVGLAEGQAPGIPGEEDEGELDSETGEPEPGNENEEKPPAVLKPKDPSDRLASSVTTRAAKFGGAITGGFKGDEKFTHDEVGFEHPAKGPHHCSQCAYFVKRDYCQVVVAPIAPEDWCKKFEDPGAEVDRDDAVLDKSFEESKHPRGQPENAGQFTSGSAGRTSHVKASHANAGELLKDPSLPAHIKALKVPPAWTNVTYASDPDADLLVTGRDAKGRAQAIYSKRFADSQAAAKFARVKELNEKFEHIRQQNEEARRSKDPKVKDSADALRLIMETGIRPGSQEDTLAAKKAYGATTLEGRHVTETKDGVHLRFTGKKGVNLDIPVHDPETAKMLLARARASGAAGQLFPNIGHRTLLAHTHSLNGGSFKTKDFRTLLGTKTALDEIAKTSAPTSATSYKKAVMEVAKRVASCLGNTPTVALQAYINPVLFADWRAHAGA